MKIGNNQIWFSRANNCVVRVVRADQVQKCARVKHHESQMIEEEVLFSDLIPATNEQVKAYLKAK